jgi:hypothetical protein
MTGQPGLDWTAGTGLQAQESLERTDRIEQLGQAAGTGPDRTART